MKRGILSVLCTFLLIIPAVHAQWAVTDPINPAQGIVDSVNEVVETPETMRNTMPTFKGTSRIYEQSKKYCDMPKNVDSLISGGLRVKGSVLMLSEISESYMMSYGKMLTDRSYTQRELEAITSGYGNIMRKNGTSVAGLKGVINPAGMSMTDKGWLDLIRRVCREMRRYKTLANYYIRKNLRVSYLRIKEKGETEQVLELYGEGERYW